jgi:hypothetical protein
VFKKSCSVGLLSLSVLLSGCAQVNSLTGNTQSNADIASKIKIGKTTRSQVIDYLGDPDSDNIISGREVMTYALSDNLSKAGSAASVASSVMGYVPVLSSFTGYTAQASSAATKFSKTKHVNITVKNNIVQDLSVIEN